MKTTECNSKNTTVSNSKKKELVCYSMGGKAVSRISCEQKATTVNTEDKGIENQIIIGKRRLERTEIC